MPERAPRWTARAAWLVPQLREGDVLEGEVVRVGAAGRVKLRLLGIGVWAVTTLALTEGERVRLEVEQRLPVTVVRVLGAGGERTRWGLRLLG